jgi:hypothetical protein
MYARVHEFGMSVTFPVTASETHGNCCFWPQRYKFLLLLWLCVRVFLICRSTVCGAPCLTCCSTAPWGV